MNEQEKKYEKSELCEKGTAGRIAGGIYMYGISIAFCEGQSSL